MASGTSNTVPPPRRGRPRLISQAQIVAAAIELGFDSFSIQSIADHLGVTAPALYTHVRGRDEIVELVAADLMGRLHVPESVDWREWLLEFGRQTRVHFADAGRALQVDLSGPLAMRRLEVGERGLRLLTEAGFSPAGAGMALWLVFRAACTAGPSDAASVATPMSEARRVAEPGSLPAIDRAIDAIGEGAGADTFDFDLRVILAGLEQQLLQA